MTMTIEQSRAYVQTLAIDLQCVGTQFDFRISHCLDLSVRKQDLGIRQNPFVAACPNCSVSYQDGSGRGQYSPAFQGSACHASFFQFPKLLFLFVLLFLSRLVFLRTLGLFILSSEAWLCLWFFLLLFFGFQRIARLGRCWFGCGHFFGFGPLWFLGWRKVTSSIYPNPPPLRLWIEIAAA